MYTEIEDGNFTKVDEYFEDIENTKKNNQIIKEFEDSLKQLENSNNNKEDK